ncbi:MAG: hydroxymethylglutaryl-CoA lyase [Sphingobacteriia bacterium 24-36-13]|nr:MAG: hydroxymethylglutaryl-CoA lyase [Sphingobacteriia bacterium 24-36-13]OZA64696.1 MAG: hydroxymethylglutaryl-CoA lyase [Sphingobacteriia bacterium 39-39-8]
MQGWSHAIATVDKIRYLNSLLKVGFHSLDFGSFVSPKAIPQMADTALVLAGLDQSLLKKNRLLVIVANLRGAATAMTYPAIQYIGFPFSLSPTFQLRNTNSSMEQSLETVRQIQLLCQVHNKELVLYLSMGFGNPYGDDYHAAMLLDWTERLVEMGIGIISVADTVGMASPIQINTAIANLVPRFPETVIGVHLHSSQTNFQDKLQAAIDGGCIRFDGAIKGIGGCPMAQDQLVGNMDTIAIINYLKSRGMDPQLDEMALSEAIIIADQIFDPNLNA